jgi:hypothetical protein
MENHMKKKLVMCFGAAQVLKDYLPIGLPVEIYKYAKN